MLENIENRVRDIIVQQLGVHPEEVVRTASFRDDLGADSLDTVELIMAFEEETGETIPEKMAEKLKTVGDVLDYLSARGG